MRYRWFAKDEEKDDFGEPVSRALWDRVEPEEKGDLTRGGKAGAFFAFAAMCYALWAEDLQLFLFCMAVMLYLLHPLPLGQGGQGKLLSNFLRGFSLALGWGILIWVLL